MPAVRGPGATLGLRPFTENGLSEFSRFEVFRVSLFTSSTASGHLLPHFELPSGRYLPKAGPVGPAQGDDQTVETVVRSETVVGAGDIAFRRCGTGGSGFLELSLHDVISEIARILARGYMRHQNGRRIPPNCESGAEHVA